MVFEQAWAIVKEGDWVPIDPSHRMHPEHHEIWDETHEITYNYVDRDDDGNSYWDTDYTMLSMRDLANFFKDHVFPQQNPAMRGQPMSRVFPQFITIGPSDEIKRESDGERRRIMGEGQMGGRSVADTAKSLENKLVTLHGQEEYQRHMDELLSSMALEGER